ncbi:SusC/RagA family TonB-linked outer membrane protein [Mucilaginibacter arboris]|uniref:SusC/RagA family TonB-linked outer membrane protein n=1 Tax=Mucilaginibacter arboris TaxID=2682090 RepID=A0A7K1ST96_9SPHI|nr:TonB-dependent receptor [Mucilaginibacter arboris]MVN20477.1 SusC/RagA family TonB-linked outer membrane protein [Mucilaginibacter arboris]
MKIYNFKSSGGSCTVHKILLAMKLIFLLMFTALLQAQAVSLAQGKITLSAKNEPLEKVLKQIRKQSGFDLVFISTDIERAKPVTINVKEETLENTLKQCFLDQPFEFSIQSKAIVVQEKRVQGLLKNIQNILMDIRGKVVDESGLGLPGASVKVKGTATGTMTDANGRFSFKGIDENAVLVVSFLSYETQEVKAAAKSEMVIKLKAKSGSLNEIVVVGYGTQKKENLTGAVSVVKGSDLENRPVVNVTQSLQGLVPGLNVNVGGNTKPGQSFNLNVRGTANLSGSDSPYVLVDGLEMSLADVNPNDIESISVLKDASAAAIYGARAAYGVILVTTKKGSADKMSLNYSGNVGLTSPVKLPDMANSLEFANYFNAATFNALGTKQYSDDKLALLAKYINDPTGMSIFPEVNSNNYSNWENSSNGVANTNWFKLHYKPFAVRQDHNLSMSGGSNQVQYYISGGYYNEGGSLRYADINYDRYNLNAKVTSQLAKWIKVKANTKYTTSKNVTPLAGFENLFFHNLARMRPNVSPYDLNGNWSEQSMVPYLQSGSKAQNNNTTLALLTGLELEPVKKWKIFMDLNLRQQSNESSSLKLPGTIYGIDGTPIAVNRSEYNIPIKGSYGRTMEKVTYLSPNIYTNYAYSIQQKHNFDLTVGYQQESNQYSSLTANAQDLISANRPGISLSTGAQTIAESRTHWATMGAFGRLTYNYKSKYLLEMNGRYDGSSRFAAGSRWGFFPSFSAGYNLAQEKFMQDKVSWIDELKIRGSYGFLGNQSGAGLYSYSENMNVSTPGIGTGPRYYFGSGREANIYAPGAFNPFVTWEKVENTDFGLDMSAFKGRLNLTLDVYQRNTRDMLGPTLDIADMYGTTPPVSNNADLRNRGWEISLNWRGNISEKITYTIGGLLADSKSIVTKYQNPTKSNPTATWYEGKTVGEIWGYRTSGLIQNAADAAAYNKLDRSYLTSIAWVPGDVAYRDLNGDNKINRGANKVGDMGDLTIIGNSTPRYLYSLNGSLSWKGLSMYMLWQGVGKRDFAPQLGDAYFWGSGALAQVTVFKQHLDYWTPANPNAYYPNPYASPVGSINSYINKTQQISDRYLQDASYLRLKNFTLSYNLPLALISRMKLKKVNVFLTGENLLTFTKLAKMLDPETLATVSDQNNNLLTPSADAGKIYPLSKVYSIGLNIGL